MKKFKVRPLAELVSEFPQPRFEKEECLKELLKEYRRLGLPFRKKTYTPSMAVAEVKEKMKLIETNRNLDVVKDNPPEMDIPIDYEVEFMNGDWYVSRCRDGEAIASAKLPPIVDHGEGVYTLAYDENVNLMVTQGTNAPDHTFKVSDFLGASDEETEEAEVNLGELPHGFSHKPTFLLGMEGVPSPPSSPVLLASPIPLQDVQEHDTSFLDPPQDNLVFTFIDLNFLYWEFSDILQKRKEQSSTSYKVQNSALVSHGSFLLLVVMRRTKHRTCRPSHTWSKPLPNARLCTQRGTSFHWLPMALCSDRLRVGIGS